VSNVYDVSYDGLVSGVTLFTGLLLGGLGAMFAWMAASGAYTGWVRATLLGVVVLCVGVLGIGWLYKTSAYRIDGNELIVDRPVGDVHIALSEISSVRSDPSPFAGAIRTAGNGGLFGFWGRFRGPSGPFTAYATRRDRGVVVATRERIIVLTPDDPERLVADLEGRLGAAANPQGV
jgi:hypothetical protein